jgi:hypothetical protein
MEKIGKEVGLSAHPKLEWWPTKSKRKQTERDTCEEIGCSLKKRKLTHRQPCLVRAAKCPNKATFTSLSIGFTYVVSARKTELHINPCFDIMRTLWLWTTGETAGPTASVLTSKLAQASLRLTKKEVNRETAAFAQSTETKTKTLT